MNGDNNIDNYITNLQNLKTEYTSYFKENNEDFENEYIRLISHKENKKKINYDKEQKLLNEYANNFIEYVLKDIEKKIKKHYGKGEEFNSIKSEITKIKKELYTNTNIVENMVTYEKIKNNIINAIEEKIINLKYNNKQIKKNILINIIIAIFFFIAGIIINIKFLNFN